jgi:hypothetical protein
VHQVPGLLYYVRLTLGVEFLGKTLVLLAPSMQLLGPADLVDGLVEQLVGFIPSHINYDVSFLL